jgi:hypothetical protein
MKISGVPATWESCSTLPSEITCWDVDVSDQILSSHRADRDILKARLLVASRWKDATGGCILSNLILAALNRPSAALTATAMADAFATLCEEGESCYSDPS